MTDRNRALARWHLRGAHRLWWRLVASLPMALLLAVLLLRFGVDDAEKNLARAQRELKALRPRPVPDDENAFTFYRQAYNLLARSAGQWNNAASKEKTADQKQEEERDPEWALCKKVEQYLEEYSRVEVGSSELNEFLKRHAPVFQKLEEAAQRQRFFVAYEEYDESGSNSIYRERDITECLGKLLSIRAQDFAHRGDHPNAARDLGWMFAMARHWNRVHIDEGSYFAYAATTMALQKLVSEETPKRVGDVSAYLEMLRRQPLPITELVAFTSANFHAQLIASDQYFLGGNTPGMPLVICCWPAMPLPAPPPTIVETLGNEWSSLVKKTDYARQYTRERRECCVKGEALLDALRRREPPPFIRPENDVNVAGRFIHAESRVYGLRSSEWEYVEQSERIECAKTAFAALAFRIKYQRDAKTLDELVPEFIPSVPTAVLAPHGPQRVRVVPASTGLKNPDEEYEPGDVVIESALNNVIYESYTDSRGEQVTLKYTGSFALPPMRK